MRDYLINYPLWFLYTALGLISLAVGSLLNVIIYRLPLMLEQEWKQQSNEQVGNIEEKKDTINLFFPRSFCPSCKTRVKAWQNIPILSYLVLRARCGSCNNPISIRYPLIELSTMLLSSYAAWHFGFTIHLLAALTVIWISICLIFIDLDHHILPDSLTLGLLWFGLIANTSTLFTSLPQAVFGAASAYIGLWLFIKIVYLVTKKVGMGHGDFKLFAALGAWFGGVFLPFILILSSLMGAVIGLVYLHVQGQSKDTPIPFGPFLCISGLLVLFWGEEILNCFMGVQDLFNY